MASISSIATNKLFSKCCHFDFVSICVPSEELKPTETITWTGKHKDISVSNSSNLLDQPIFLFDEYPQCLIFEFVANLELLAEMNKTKVRSKILEIENSTKKRIHAFWRP